MKSVINNAQRLNIPASVREKAAQRQDALKIQGLYLVKPEQGFEFDALSTQEMSQAAHLIKVLFVLRMAIDSLLHLREGLFKVPLLFAQERFIEEELRLIQLCWNGQISVGVSSVFPFVALSFDLL